MDAELFQAIGTQAIAAAEPKIVKPAAEPAHVYGVAKSNGDLEWFDAEPPPRSHTAASLDAVADFAVEHRDTAEIWFDRRGVTCYLDRATRRDAVNIKLELSPQLHQLLAWERQGGTNRLSQSALILMLRTLFGDCLAPAGELLAILRRVKFTNNVAGDTTIQHGRASIGRSIEQEVSGAGILPEYVVFDVPIFGSVFLEFRGLIRCALEPDAATQTFALIPMPQSIETAIAAAEARIGEDIVGLVNSVGDGGTAGQGDLNSYRLIPVLYGRP